jgi:phosphate-selective porin OprO/OprP
MGFFLRNLLLAGTGVMLVTPAMAQADARLGAMEEQLRGMRAEIADLKKAQTAASVAPRVGLDNGRLTVTSADGAFSIAVRALLQYDYGYFAQSRAPAGVDLSSGSNFRRAQFGVTGTAWRDWSYNLTFDFGGNGQESPGYIYNAFIQYDGLKPFGFRLGAYTPAAGIEDQTGSADLIFLERPAAVDAARNIAGSPARTAASVFVQDASYFLSASITGDKVNVGATRALATPVYDEQLAFVGRASLLAVNTPDAKWLLDANLTHVFKPGDTAPGGVPLPGALNSVGLSGGPEIAIDPLARTVNTGGFDTDAVTQYGFETAGTLDALYVQGGWFHTAINRRNDAIVSPDFSGWYAAATWSLTGEQHPYDPATASFRQIRPAKGLGNGGFVAFELKARWSHINLDFNPLTPTASGGVIGGIQDVWTLGLNWHPTNGIRFGLDYNNIKVNHVNAPATDISADAVALRTQLSL